jgi:hypothetical protein
MEETEANQQLFTHNLVLPVKSIVPVIMLSPSEFVANHTQCIQTMKVLWSYFVISIRFLNANVDKRPDTP